jgi:ATP-dependent protease HslVU (ClpYQ) peptidase subunit
MTTILANTKTGVLYSDTQTTVSHISTGYTSFERNSAKIRSFKNKDHWIGFGASGDVTTIREARLYFTAKGNLPETMENNGEMNILILTGNPYNFCFIATPNYKKRFDWWGAINQYKVEWEIKHLKDEWVALGSGADFALAFLYMGYYAKDAIKHTAKLDRYTNNEVISVEVNKTR